MPKSMYNSSSKKLLSNIFLDEISLVPKGANEDARVVLVKSATDEDDVLHYEITSACDVFVKSCSLGVAKSTDFATHIALIVQNRLNIEALEKLNDPIWALYDSIASVISSENDEEKRSDMIKGNIDSFLTYLRSSGIMKTAPDLSDEEIQRALKVADGGRTNEVSSMEAKELKEKLAAAEDRVAKLEEEVSKSEDVKKAFCAALDEAGYDVDDSGAITKREEPETVEIDGVLIAKSAVPEPVLKMIMQQHERLEKMAKESRDRELIAKADELLPNLAGDALQKGQLIELIEKMGEEDSKAIMKSLKAADAAVSKNFEEIGQTSGNSDTSDDNASKLDEMVRKHAQENDVDYHRAYAEVTKTGPGAVLFAKISQ